MSQIAGLGAPPVAPGATRVYLVAAVSLNGVIGKCAKVPCRLPDCCLGWLSG